ncbi:hypothetical protein BJP34_25035 [Moorena producens PAL-8-15-08-1]|uniref:Uncharacterized protein n=1 Tax=Moorena producens PAL-8-15-08-1 TaxID=1458985 RepID=A0A1D8TX78_9CYAN|nr:hypothetical protein BJP34_25035 [Moorena producens PAL-8-15-08-1]
MKVLGYDSKGAGSREQGTGNREQGTGNREEAIGMLAIGMLAIAMRWIKTGNQSQRRLYLITAIKAI